MTTARDIVADALRKIQVLGTGQQLSADDAQRGFRALNQMLSLESTDSYNIYNETVETFNLNEGQASYTFGTSGQDFNTTRPLSITNAYVTGGGEIDYYLTEYDQAQYSKITNKTDRGIPSVWYYDANYPVPTIYLYQVPSGVSTITIYSQKALEQFANLDANFVFPPEYETFLIYNLALFIAGEYQREPLPEVKKTAQRARDRVENQNIKNKKYVGQIDSPRAENSEYIYNVYRGY